jgi:predicted nucleotidyltransferase component of viral defense system
MLHKNAVPLNLLAVLESLQEATHQGGFALAGGTSLALRFGHRQSVDLDFFTERGFEPLIWADAIGVGPESITGMAAGTLQVMLDGVKVEFLKHAYPKLAGDDLIQGIRMWSLRDVAAMKLNAVSNRGSKKDFYDLAMLLDHFPLDTLIRYYQEKYRPASLMMVIRSLAWFDDADAEPDPISLHNDTWPAVMDKISSAIRALE